MRLAYAPVMLRFRQPAGTSRGVLTQKPTYLLKVWDEEAPHLFGIGEAAVFPGLSPEADGRYEYKIVELLANMAIGRSTDLSGYSSLRFGLEQALRDFASGGRGIYFDSPFVRGESRITINGLVWMGSFEQMQQRVEEKVKAGFSCIKIKVGAIDWQSEIDLIETLRRRFSRETLEIRVDANGGFSMEQALPRMARLARLGVHSIEQPIAAGHPDLMAFLCQVSPLPIALDEELIGIEGKDHKAALLEEIKPAYIILKPALCGGFSGAEEWITEAAGRGIGWWATSALESNVGLDAIAQWVGTLGVTIPQGLGTGALYTDNFSTPLRLHGEQLNYDAHTLPDRNQFASLDWRE